MKKTSLVLVLPMLAAATVAQADTTTSLQIVATKYGGGKGTCSVRLDTTPVVIDLDDGAIEDGAAGTLTLERAKKTKCALIMRSGGEYALDHDDHDDDRSDDRRPWRSLPYRLVGRTMGGDSRKVLDSGALASESGRDESYDTGYGKKDIKIKLSIKEIGYDEDAHYPKRLSDTVTFTVCAGDVDCDSSAS